MMEKTQQAQGTTFVHADACNFMEVVQRLTGPNKDHLPPPSPPPLPPPPPTSPKITGIRKPAFKLHERRQGSRSSSSSSSLMILKPDHTLSPSPKLILSPPFSRPLLPSPSQGLSQLVLCDKESNYSPSLSSSSSSSSCLNEAEEEKAIRERRFYLHPSPRSGSNSSRVSDPQLLPLFPLTAPPKPQGT